MSQIRMRALCSFAGEAGEGRIKKQREFSVADERRADELVRHGLAERLDAKAEAGAPSNKMEPPPANKSEPFKLTGPNVAGNTTVPLSRVGGETGGEKSPSSSPRGRRPRQPDSPPREDGQES